MTIERAPTGTRPTPLHGARTGRPCGAKSWGTWGAQSALQLKFWQKESERMSCASLATSLVLAVKPT